MKLIGLILAVLIGILVLGVVLKLLKIAIILAVCVGIVLFAQSKFGRKQIR